MQLYGRNFYFDDSQIAIRVRANQRRRYGRSIAKSHFDLVCSIDDVIVGHNVSILIPNKTGAKRGLKLLLWSLLLRQIKEWETRNLRHVCSRISRFRYHSNVDHGWAYRAVDIFQCAL